MQHIRHKLELAGMYIFNFFVTLHSKRIKERFMITADQLKDIKDRTEALHRYLQIENKLIEVQEEELRTQAPGFWSSPTARQS